MVKLAASVACQACANHMPGIIVRTFLAPANGHWQPEHDLANTCNPCMIKHFPKLNPNERNFQMNLYEDSAQRYQETEVTGSNEKKKD